MALGASFLCDDALHEHTDCPVRRASAAVMASVRVAVVEVADVGMGVVERLVMVRV